MLPPIPALGLLVRKLRNGSTHRNTYSSSPLTDSLLTAGWMLHPCKFWHFLHNQKNLNLFLRLTCIKIVTTSIVPSFKSIFGRSWSKVGLAPQLPNNAQWYWNTSQLASYRLTQLNLFLNLCFAIIWEFLHSKHRAVFNNLHSYPKGVFSDVGLRIVGLSEDGVGVTGPGSDSK